MASGLVAHATAAGGSLRALAAVTTDIIEEARQRHGLYPTAAAAVGRTMSAAALMGAQLKGGQKVMLQISGDGPLRQVVADADAAGNVRGYAANPHVHFPLNPKGKLDVARAVGNGNLIVVKDLGMKEPYRGLTPIVSGEIAEDVAHYFAQSEQVPSAVSLGVLVESDGSVRAAGGLLIQLLPGAEAELIDRLEARITGLQSVSHMVSLGMSPADILNAALHELDLRIVGETKLQFFCGCSRERLGAGLVALGQAELEDILAKEGEAELTCNFCAEKYAFSKDDLLELIDDITAQRAERNPPD